MSGSALNAGRHYIVNGKGRSLQRSRPLGSPKWPGDTGCGGKGLSREDLLGRPALKHFVALVLTFEHH